MSTLLELLNAKKAELQAASGDRRKVIKPADGSTRYRILPSWRGAGKQFWHDFGQHFIKGQDKKIMAVYVCTEKTFGKPCPVCDVVAQGIASASDDETTNLVKEARSSGRYLLNVLAPTSPTPGEVQILDLSPMAFSQVVTLVQQYEDEGQSMLDPVEGRDVIIERTGTGIQTKYCVFRRS